MSLFVCHCGLTCPSSAFLTGEGTAKFPLLRLAVAPKFSPLVCGGGTAVMCDTVDSCESASQLCLSSCELRHFLCLRSWWLTFSEKVELALGEKRWNDGDDTAYPHLEKILVRT